MANDIKNEIQLEKLMGEDGDTAFSLDLQSNVLVTAQFIFDHYESTFSNNYYNIYLIEMGTFYELFFKYKLSLINRSLIWDKPEQFNRDKHDNALMKTISADLALSYAFNFGWVNEKEKTLINEMKTIRNKLVHFSACEPSEEENTWRCEIIKGKDIRANLKLIKRLLEESKDMFETNYLYKIIQDYKAYKDVV